MKRARDFFRGEGKYNCAQALLAAFRDKYKVTDEQIAACSRLGAGKAPGGICGALHVIKLLDEPLYETKKAEAQFKEKAGSTICREIRKLKKYSCQDCIDLSESILNL